MEKEYCCIDLEHHINEDNIEVYDGGYYMNGCPTIIANDRGFSDDMTESFTINYCPFCGATL